MFRAVPDLAVEPKVTQGVDVSARVRVHRHRRTCIADEFVHLVADAHRVVDDRAAWGVGHPHAIVGVSRRLPAGHADVVVHR